MVGSYFDVRLSFVSLFPDSLRAGFERGVIARAVERGRLTTRYVDPRDFTYDRHRKVDDRPFSGEPGMLLKAEPVALAIESLGPARRLAPDPTGPVFDQRMAKGLAAEAEIVFICGHYEGIDQRAMDALKVEPVSLGSFVISGGDLAAATMADAIARLLPGVLGDEASLAADSFGDVRYSAPNYTRPAEWRGRAVPEALLSGDPKKIDAWRREESRRLAAERPDPAREAIRGDLRERFRYDRWANRLWAPLIPALHPEGLTTFEHMRWAMNMWLSRLSPSEDGMSWEHLYVGWDDVLARRDPAEDVNYRMRNGRPGQATVGTIARQVANHGTYHRGDLRRLATDRSVDFPETDWPYYDLARRSGDVT